MASPHVKRVEENGDEFDGLVDQATGQRRYGTLLLVEEGIRYIGDFKDDSPSGVATIVYPDKSKFEGTHNNFVFEKGEFTFEDGERHEGTWLDK